MTNLLLGSIGEPIISEGLAHLLGPAFTAMGGLGSLLSTSLGFFFVTYLTVVFSEQLPKVLAIRYIATVASLVARPVKLLLTITWPLVWVMNKSANLVTRPLGLGDVEQA